MEKNDGGVAKKGPDTYTDDELRIASEELLKASSAFVASGAEFASYPVKVGRAPPRWVKFIGVNQLSRAAIGFAQATKDRDSARVALMHIGDTAARLQEKVMVYESIKRFDHLRLAIFGKARVKSGVDFIDIEAG